LTQISTPVLKLYGFKQTAFLFMYCTYGHIFRSGTQDTQRNFLSYTYCVWVDRGLFHSQPRGKYVHKYKIVLLLDDALRSRSQHY